MNADPAELPDDLITPKEAAKLLRCHLATAYRMIVDGRLRAWRRGPQRLLVSRADVLALFEPVTPSPAPATADVNPRSRAARAQARHADEVLARWGL